MRYTVVITALVGLLAAGCTTLQGSDGRSTNGWRLVWHDEFNGQTIDRNKWSFDTGGSGWGNDELEYYTSRPANARIENGYLVIQARSEAHGGRRYTSARLKTQGHFSFTYGRVEARIEIPRGDGMWPAFWLLGSDIPTVSWPACGEIDVMENIGREPNTIHGSLHGPGYSGSDALTKAYPSPTGVPFAEGFHLYAVQWSPEEIVWSVDGYPYFTVSRSDLPSYGKWVFDRPFFILLNVAVGGMWPGSPTASTGLPQTMLVDFVRVYQRMRHGE